MWKTANVVSIHKRSSKAAVCIYRPVSLPSVMSKVMETIINKQLMNHLDRHELVTTREFGFRKGLGTADLLTVLHHEWATTVRRGGLVRVVAIDIAGAFDLVSHAGLIHQVASMGIAGQLLTWLSDYLSGGRLQVVVGGQHSATFPIRAGVPQGSILGPTQILLYINDAKCCISPDTRLAVYADDTTLYAMIQAITDINMSAESLQQSIQALAEWGKRWWITFEPTKSQCMSISTQRAQLPISDLTFDCTILQHSDSIKNAWCNI